MNKDLTCLIEKYLNGYKIVKVEYDPFIKGQINLFTDEWEYEAFNDKSLVIFRVRNKPNTAKIYQELVDEENINYKQALNEIRECCEDNAIEVNTREYGNLVVTNTDDILQIIAKVLGDD